MNSDVFKEELEMIQNGQIRQMVREYFDMSVQKYFFELASSKQAQSS